MLWFNFILGSNFILFLLFFFCMKMFDDDYKTKGSKIKPKD